MGRSNDLSAHALPKHSWPARQKEKLDKPGATDRFNAVSSKLCEQMQASVPLGERTKMFHQLTEAVQSICDSHEFQRNISIFWDMKVHESPVSAKTVSTGSSPARSRSASRPRHRAVAVGYCPNGLSRSQRALFPVDSPIPDIEGLRIQRQETIAKAAFLLVGDSGSRAFSGSGVPKILQHSLLAMGPENFDMINPMKAFQGSSFNHMGCPLGLLSHLTFIYQCEIRDDGKITLNVIWVKVVKEEDDDSSVASENTTYKLRYCKAPVDSFDLTIPQKAAKLFAWLHAINKWALKERFEALKLAQQLDEVRHRRFQNANVSLLQEFGADLTTEWLSEQILKSIPSPPTLDRQSIGSSVGSPATNMRKTLAKRAKKQLSPPPPTVQPPPPTPPPMMAWKGLIPAHKLDGFPRKDEFKVPDRTRASSADANMSSGREVSAVKFLSSGTDKNADFHQRLLMMTAIYDAILKSPQRARLEADIHLHPNSAVSV